MSKNKEIEFFDTDKVYVSHYRRNFDRRYVFKIYILKYIPIFVLVLSLGLWGALLGAAWWLYFTIFHDHRDIYTDSPVIRVWFGVPGSGKSSMGALLSKRSRDRKRIVLSNYQLEGAYRVQSSDLGNFDMSFDDDGCHVLLDEASADFDNRNFKAFACSNAKNYFSLHRHMNNQVDVFSQGYDIDKRIRDRAGENGLYHLKKFPLRGYIMYRNISKVFFIKKEDMQIMDGFKYRGLPRIIRSKSVWGSFDTLDKSLCPTEHKVWEKW